MVLPAVWLACEPAEDVGAKARKPFRAVDYAFPSNTAQERQRVEHKVGRFGLNHAKLNALEAYLVREGPKVGCANSSDKT